ncbi:BTAD domain-containing putative transcriptional regulator [Dactylosporangium sp. NPDC049140]|uniref:AfsR/SARP family transcriptional regulator n=1 Tax=Dactylosporangium sp. NPDC049140 TaxID=3155647 RepID=UPI0033FD110A
MEYGILGPVEVRAGGVPVNIGGPREHRSLAALLLQANRTVSAERLVDVLWGERPPPTAAAQVRNTIATLRRHLAAASGGEPPVARSGTGYLIQVADGALDAVVFDGHVTRARSLAEQGRLGAAAEALRAASGLWRGPALGGLGGPMFDAEAQGLEERRLACVERRIELELALGRHQDLLGELANLVAAHPFRERLAELQILCLHRAGRRHEALEAFAATRARLADRTGLEPGPELARLQLAILRGDPALDAPPTADRAAAPPAVPRPIPAQLPADVPAFTGRAACLKQLDALLPPDEPDHGATVVVSAIAGTAGVGKTATAVHWAHQVRDRFGDGQLYVNLRGFDPGEASVGPGEALRGFLDALGVEPSRVPAETDTQAALFRSLMRDRRMLVVLDNARDAAQVRPLLPGGPGCLVVVTSRNRLPGLVAAQGAHPVLLDLLSPAEARELLVRRLSRDRATAEPQAVDEIVAYCAGLPLAVVIAAARAAARPDFPLAALARELREAQDRLDAFAGDDPATDLRAVFFWSYRALRDDTARLFRLVGLHPGPDIAAPAAASLAGRPLPDVVPLLAELVQAQLITEHAPGRYTLHDLLRAYAAELARTHDPEPARRLATRRMLEHYLHTSHSAARLLTPVRRPIAPAGLVEGVTVTALAGSAEALTWLTAEQPVLLAILTSGPDEDVRHLAWSLGTFLHWRGRLHDWVTVERAALEACRRLADRRGQAHAHRSLSRAFTLLVRFDDAHTHAEHALHLAADHADPTGEAHARFELTWALSRQGRYREALAQAERAHELFEAAGHRPGTAKALNGVGNCLALLGDYDRALVNCERAMTLFRELSDRKGEAASWDGTGFARHHLGQHDLAVDCHRRAIELYVALGDRIGEVEALIRLGNAQYATGDTGAARETWGRALSILDDLAHPDAEHVRAQITAVATGLGRARTETLYWPHR